MMRQPLRCGVRNWVAAMRGNMRHGFHERLSTFMGLSARLRALRALCCGSFLLAAGGCSDKNEDQTTGSLNAGYAIWAGSPQSYDEILPFPNVPPPQPLAFNNQTVRQIVRVSAGGDAVRVHFSNLFGSDPLFVFETVFATSGHLRPATSACPACTRRDPSARRSGRPTAHPRARSRACRRWP